MENIKKIYINDMDEDKRNELIKKNEKLVNRLIEELYQLRMFDQEEVGRSILGTNTSNFLEFHDHYGSFYLTLKNWYKFLEEITIEDYFLTDEALNLYDELIEKKEMYDCMEYDTTDFWKLDEELEEKSKKLLKMIEDELHTYEEAPTIDEAIEYADEMEHLDGYYIEEREDGTTDGVIRYDVSYTETFI